MKKIDKLYIEFLSLEDERYYSIFSRRKLRNIFNNDVLWYNIYKKINMSELNWYVFWMCFRCKKIKYL